MTGLSLGVKECILLCPASEMGCTPLPRWEKAKNELITAGGTETKTVVRSEKSKAVPWCFSSALGCYLGSSSNMKHTVSYPLKPSISVFKYVHFKSCLPFILNLKT
jgi:hypothetical protein